MSGVKLVDPTTYMSRDRSQIKNEECQKTSMLAGGFSFYSTFICISGRGK